MKKITKIIPLVLFPSLIMVACAKANDANQKSTIVNNNDNGITEYEVTVDFNGGKFGEQTSITKKVRDGTYYDYFKLELPTKEQITYIGHELKFYSIKDTTTEIPDSYRFRRDVTIVAQYDITGTQHTVTWKNHNDTTLATESYCEGETPVYKGEAPVHDPVPGKSYTWTGWDPEIAPLGTTDVTYTATYSEPEITECVVSFDTKGGSAIAPILVNKGDKIATAPTNPTKTGYTFDKPEGKSGWYYGSDVEFVFGTTQVNTDMTLYCKWKINKYEITFDAEGGKWATTTGDDLTVDVEHGTLPEPNEELTPPEGKIFDGWTPKIVPATGKTTYKAQWTAYYTVSFDTRGGTFVPSVQVKIGGTVSKPNPLPTWEGHNLSDWRYMKPGQETPEQFLFNEDGTPTQVNNDMTVFCTWTKNSYKVRFAPNGGAWSDSTGTGDKIFTQSYGTLPNPFGGDVTLTRDNYIFTGWKRLSDGGIGILPIDVTDEGKEYCEEYTAQWTPVQLAISFDTDGGEPIAPISVTYGGSVTLPETATKEGYTFNAWYTDRTYTTPFPTTNITASATAYAKFTATKVDVTFKPNGGTWDDESTEDKPIQVDYNTVPTVPGTLTKDGYIFTGWSPVISIVTTATTYTAQWEKAGDTYYTVTFDTDGGSTVIEQHVKENDKAIKPADPTRAGSTFKNWYLEDPATAFDFDTAITEAITLHANWEAAKYTVTWYDEDGTTVLDSKNDYAYNASLVLPVASKTPAKFVGNDRYFFKKWSPNASTSMKVTENMNFYAVYERDNEIHFNFSSTTYTIEGALEFSATYNYGGVIGLTFDGPYFPQTITLEADGKAIPTTDYTYNATTGELSLATSSHDWRVINLTA